MPKARRTNFPMTDNEKVTLAIWLPAAQAEAERDGFKRDFKTLIAIEKRLRFDMQRNKTERRQTND